tara:strand:+ start:1372 stop:2586 length:1215 start_codon:yes stop_codon:yes gene_type:complete
MTDDNIIKINNISKKYLKGKLKDDSLRGTLHSVIKGNSKGEEFWALKKVSFTAKKGEVIGIIGKNGAGKSTLLKILSQITKPSEGYIELSGRVASLLEVGTGFHPELTGRENIFLNGTILGMSRKEIKLKFNDIVNFSGVDKFLDTAVKHYSSGMYVRLAFAVAAYLEPEILIIDEVLAVGDADFQKKCLGKMKDVAESGRTVLFVSHNIAAVKSLCDRAIYLEKGEIIMDDDCENVIKRYLNNINVNNTESLENEFIKIHSSEINENSEKSMKLDEKLKIKFSFSIKRKPKNSEKIIVVISVKDYLENIVYLTNNLLEEFVIPNDRNYFNLFINFENLYIKPNNYLINLQIRLNEKIIFHKDIDKFEIIAHKYFPMDYLPFNFPSTIVKRSSWELIDNNPKII